MPTAGKGLRLLPARKALTAAEAEAKAEAGEARDRSDEERGASERDASASSELPSNHSHRLKVGRRAGGGGGRSKGERGRRAGEKDKGKLSLPHLTSHTTHPPPCPSASGGAAVSHLTLTGISLCIYL